jgi:hypothetical protein
MKNTNFTTGTEGKCSFQLFVYFVFFVVRLLAPLAGFSQCEDGLTWSSLLKLLLAVQLFCGGETVQFDLSPI